MNREILFKAKRKSWKELPKEEWWVEGDLIQQVFNGTKRMWISESCDKERLRSVHKYETEWRAIEIDPETLCQFTGLADKNDKKIWENDIVNCWTCIDVGDFANYHIEIGYVEMNYGSFGLHRIQDDTYYRPFKGYFEDYSLHVIGNIFDNPGILEVE